MSNLNHERPGFGNISRGLSDSDQARRDRAERAARREPAERPTWGADAATLSEWLEEDPSLYEDMSNAQRISLGFHQRQIEREYEEGEQE